MSWIAVTQPEAAQAGPASPPAFPGLRVVERADRKTELPRGSVYLEADLGRWKHDEQTIFVLHYRGEVISHASVHLGADGTLVYARRLGRENRQVLLRPGSVRLEGTIRLTISWNVPARRGLLSLEVVADGSLLQKEFADPLPWLQSDIARLKSPNGDVAFGPSLRCFGLSDRMEPVGIAPSLTTGTRVLTPEGYRPIEELRAGDLVETHGGRIRAICWAGSREVLARGRFRPIRLLAPYLGLGRDVIVAPEQRLLMTGPEVEYLFSSEAVLVEAHALLHSNFAALEPAGTTIRYHQILLDEHDILLVSGAPVESLFIGDLRESPEMLATTVLHDLPPERLPLHTELAYPALRNYEAMTLRAALVSR